MRNISFALTREQFIAKKKTVTRRMGWTHLKVGELLQGCSKCQGLKPGEELERLHVIRVTDVRRELLERLVLDLDYGFIETEKEGYPAPHPKHLPSEFIVFFCGSHKGCTAQSFVTRIEFEFVERTESK